jgi:Hemerythrin HHE cation binding domain
MTIIATPDLSVFDSAEGLDAYVPLLFNSYRDVHKGIRAELFDVTSSAGRLDPSDTVSWLALVDHLATVEFTLSEHAGHEDLVVEPVLAEFDAVLAESIEQDHHHLDARFGAIRELASAAASYPATDQRPIADVVYLELSGFTSEYLRHQLVEERVVMPALLAEVGLDEVLRMHLAIVSSIPPEQLAQSLSFMLPAMNLDDRAEMLGGMRETAPPPVFEGVVGLARSVLDPADFAALAQRLGLG